MVRADGDALLGERCAISPIITRREARGVNTPRSNRDRDWNTRFRPTGPLSGPSDRALWTHQQLPTPSRSSLVFSRNSSPWTAIAFECR